MWELDLSKNQIKDINLLENLKLLYYLGLSKNQIKHIDSLNNLKRLNMIYLYDNPILNSTFNFISPLKTQIYFSTSTSFNSSVLNESINQFNEVYVFIDLTDLNSTNISNQKEHTKSIKSIKYFISANLIQLNKMFQSDCLLTIYYLKKRVHYNLFLYEQIDQFFSKCLKLEF